MQNWRLETCGKDSPVLGLSSPLDNRLAARDVFHEAVKNALVKDGWTITHDPLVLSFGEIDLYIDLGAERVLSAERDGQRIAVEVKSFNGPSLVSNFHTALGQFLNYRLALEMSDPPCQLYLAVPFEIHDSFFLLPFIQAAIRRYQLKLLVYDGETEEVIQWQS